MKSLRIIGVLFSIGLLLASVVAPAEVQALVPVSAHDFLFGHTDGVTMGMATVSLSSFGRLARQKSNLGGISKLYLYGASDFTTDFPTADDIVAGVITGALPLKAGVLAAVVTFDNGTCRIKSDRKGKLGYQNMSHSGECKMAGYEEGQIVALEKTFNEGGVAIAVYKNGKRVLLGSSNEPLEFTDATDSGAKADDQLGIDFKFTGDGYAWHPPVLDPDVVIALTV